MNGDDRLAGFRALHAAGAPLLLPNAWDYGSAALLVDAGFPALGTTSLGVAAAYGLPDGQGRTRAETVALAHRLTRLPCLVTVDIEAGFSDDPAEVADLAAELAAAGVVGINLEDGRSDGTLIPVGHQRQVLEAVRARAAGLFVNARTDTHWADAARPRPLTETLARAEVYLAAGADGIFVPGLADDRDIATVAAHLAAPLNVLYVPGRHTVGQLTDLGVARISCGSLLLRVALGAVVAAALALAGEGPVTDGVPSYARIQELLNRY